ncbi:ATPase component of various ABC-type transport systems, containing duplicated ATPase [Legionella oakridgensis ATCC 33761 = DSM 21215]|uniref:ATPase component of various ABC-type transport systems, containing duplicated ATPase n=2 Tax=Legionella oakridgensis TaxID=29423 RepID=W0B9K4_9GAMM|nr:ATPase component of various ABC-type transport systems, containing duplicated ATPase [Legionella oakridgensis ATCC 33761 = DSM 21215]
MGVVAYLADEVLVMRAGKAVEQGDCETIFNHPSHSYTRQLLESVPHV